MTPGVLSTGKLFFDSGDFSASRPLLDNMVSRTAGVAGIDIRGIAGNKRVAFVDGEWKLDHDINANYKLDGRTEFRGLQISIENKKGSVRKGVDKDGTPWEQKCHIPMATLE